MVEATKGEKGTTSSKVAEKYDITQQSASRVIRNLKTKGFLEKGERTKSQFYKPDYDGITEYVFQNIKSEKEEQKYDDDLKNAYKIIIKEVLKSQSKNTSLYDVLYSAALIEINNRINSLEGSKMERKHKGKNTEKEEAKIYDLKRLNDLIKSYLYPK